MERVEFVPRILGFLCNWCSYAGADLAGVSRIRYASNIRVIRVMCSGRVDPVFFVRAFLKGIDGIMVLGCHFGDCHYINGNYNAERRIIAAKQLLTFTTIEAERLCLDWVSAAEGERFANLVNSFVRKIAEMGPVTCENKGKNALLAVLDVLQGEVFRHVTGIEWQVTEKEDVYGTRMSRREFEEKRNAIIHREFLRSIIVRLLDGNILSVPDLALQLETAPDAVFSEICALQEKGLVVFADTKDEYARYTISR